MMKSYNSNPVLDLHGIDREYARILINDFIRDCSVMKCEKVVIIHGIGKGILQKTVRDVLQKNKCVLECKLDMFNPGQTIVWIRRD